MWTPAYQLRRYAWTAKFPLSILTDFEEFAVYDCRVKPAFLEKASTARLLYFHYKEYPQRWDEIAAIFSPQAIQQGAFDRYVQSHKKKGTQEFDDAFLDEMEDWRKRLALNLALRNANLDDAGLNFATQRIIDRIIFLRICEDRGIEPPFQLQALLSGQNPATQSIYARLQTLFHKADQRYNSGIFHFHKEKDRHESPDELTPGLEIDDATLRDIIKRLYYPDSPYVFKEVPADILGNVYERFLGNVIHLTAGHHAKVEPKPEVRKAGGVYYTPTYIVDYIVQNTVGALLGAIPPLSPSPGTPGEGRGEGLSSLNPEPRPLTPKDAAKLRILDPACGSGSFLLGAYQYLLDWHQRWYLANDPAKWSKGKNPTLRPGPAGELILSIRERKRILIDNIYGVDLDPQAVEVTKLSLLLKCLEGESAQSINDLLLFHERALPDLGDNIKCGNSLIGTDICSTDEWGNLSEDERSRLRPFDWKTEFSTIFAKEQDGFDAVIGNPPYVRMEEFKPLKKSLRQQYACHEERCDLYAYFIEKAHVLLRVGGRFGMIVSNKFLRGHYGSPLRSFLTGNACIDRIIDFAGLPVFPNATVRTIVLLTSRRVQDNRHIAYAPPLSPQHFSSLQTGELTVEQATAASTVKVPPTVLTRPVWSFTDGKIGKLLHRIQSQCQPLGEYCGGRICMGIKSGLTEAFVVDAPTRTAIGRGIVSGLAEAFVIDQPTRGAILRATRAANEIIKPLLNGRDVHRYSIRPSGKYLLYTYHGIDIGKYPAVEAHLRPFKPRLERRATRQEWFELQQPQMKFVQFLEAPKIIFPDIAITPRFALDETGHYGTNTTYFIPGKDLYLLGLLNSKLAFLYFKITCAGLEGKTETYLRFFGQYLEGFPVRRIDPAKKEDKVAHDRLVSLVDQMLSLHKSQAAAQSPTDKESLQRQIDATDRQIDRLIYDLYGLSDDEIRIIEESAQPPASAIAP